MNRNAAIGLVDRLHRAQNEFYAGGSGSALEQLLASNITWTVPGDNRIAGTYRGLEEVLDYFRLRRDLADQTFQMKRRDVLVGDGDRLAVLTDGSGHDPQRRPSLVHRGPVRGRRSADRSVLATSA